MVRKLLAILVLSAISIFMFGCASNGQANNVPVKANVKTTDYKQISLPEHNIIPGYYTKLEVDSPYVLKLKNEPLNGIDPNAKEIKEAKSRIDESQSRYGILFCEFDNMAFILPEDGHKYINCTGKERAEAMAERFLGMMGVDVSAGDAKEYKKSYKVRNINGVRAEQVTTSFSTKKIPEIVEMKFVHFRTVGEEWFCIFFYIRDEKDTKDCVESIIKSIKLTKK